MSEEKTLEGKPPAKIGSTVVFVLSLLIMALSACSFIAMIGLPVYLPPLIEPPEAAPFFLGGLMNTLTLVEIVLVVASVLLLLAALVVARNRLRWALLALVLNLVFIAALAFVAPLMQNRLVDSQFQSKLADYEAVVELVKQGDIQVPSYTYDFAPLPAGYEQLSSNGSILVDTRNDVTRVLFYTQTTLFTYEGYLYVSDDQTPAQDFTGAAWLDVRRVAPYWFYVSGKGG